MSELSAYSVSLPSPPINASAPAPPYNASLPAPPAITSSPAPPINVSAPSLPESKSLPSPALTTSARSLPVKISLPAVGPSWTSPVSASTQLADISTRFSSGSIPKSARFLPASVLFFGSWFLRFFLPNMSCSIRCVRTQRTRIHEQHGCRQFRYMDTSSGQKEKP
ncbi:MAG: hypothetical protein COB69_03110 [Phycisphaera sp.]|nr:MAG: hypothetical protein COB69_03110 [Phycisphaera sp.]